MTVGSDAERRLVTALFADVSGFTELASRLDAEAMLDVIDPVVTALSDVVARYDGFVEKFAGDALLAVFGAPVAHEDDAVRALNVALEMREELERLKESLPAEAAALALHIGVNSGRGIARTIGGEARIDYGVLGEAVILAQRLEVAAPIGEVYVSDATVRLTERAFAFEDIGELQLKGIERPVRAARLVGRRDAGPRDDAVAVGREQELVQLQGELEGGNGRVAVIGEPGVGKSRLVAEVRRRQASRWLEARCLSYGADLAYRPFVDLLQREDPGVREPYLARLLGSDPPELRNVDPDMFRRGLHDAFEHWLDATDAAVLFVEDVHWVDTPSLELISSIAPRARIIVTSREEGEEIARVLGARGSVLRLAPLARDEAVALVRALVGGKPARGYVEAIAERSGGNPFFAGELVRASTETGSDAAELPDTLEALLSARIDLLPPNAATVLQTAAVVGRRVALPLLREVEPGADDETIAALVRRRFIDHAGRETVVFHHALVQDAAYGRLLRRRRRALHASVAQAAERLYGVGDEMIELLARHLSLAQDPRAGDYLLRAGTRAQHLYANEQAIHYFHEALERGAAAADAHERLGDVFSLLARHAEADGEYEQAAATSDGAPATVRLLRKRALERLRQQRIEEGLEFLDRAEAEVGELAAAEIELQRAWVDVQDARITHQYWIGDLEAMDSAVRRARPIVERVGTAEQRVRFFASQWMVQARRDRYRLGAAALELADRALEAGLELGDESRYFSSGFTRLWAGDLALAEEHLQRSLTHAERTGDVLLRARSLTYLTIVARRRVEPESVLRLAPEARDAAVAANERGYAALVEACEAWARRRCGDAAAEELAHRAADEMRGMTQRMFIWTAYCVLLAFAVGRGDLEQATEYASGVLAPDQQQLPDDVAAALEQAVASGSREDFARAVAVCEAGGYA